MRFALMWRAPRLTNAAPHYERTRTVDARVAIAAFQNPRTTFILKKSAEETIERYLMTEPLEINPFLLGQRLEPHFQRLTQMIRGLTSVAKQIRDGTKWTHGTISPARFDFGLG